MREAAQELDLLLDVVRYAKDDTADDGEIVDFDIRLSPKVKFSKSLRLSSFCGKKKKVSHRGLRDSEKRTGQHSAHLRPLCEVKIRTADKNLNNERAEDLIFSARFFFWHGYCYKIAVNP